MGKLRINNNEHVTPADKMSVADIKQLAGIPQNERLYQKGGKVLDDQEIISTENADLGAATSWERG